MYLFLFVFFGLVGFFLLSFSFPFFLNSNGLTERPVCAKTDNLSHTLHKYKYN